jgi:hypothetical protein
MIARILRTMYDREQARLWRIDPLNERRRTLNQILDAIQAASESGTVVRIDPIEYRENERVGEWHTVVHLDEGQPTAAWDEYLTFRDRVHAEMARDAA